MEKKTIVSIIINNYNYGRFIAQAIDSALQQVYSFIEVIVVDDGSTDNSREVIATYGNHIVAIFKKNEGQASALNAGFAASKGEIICFLDADDVCFKHKIAEIVKIFTRDSSIGWCFHPLILVDLNTKAILGKTRVFPDWNPVKVADRYDLRREMKQGKLPIYLPPTSGMCLRRSILEEILPMPITFMKTSADRYLRSVATWLSPGFVLTDPLGYQGIHGQNAATKIENKREKDGRGIIIAYLLRINFPKLKKFTNRMFARSWSNYQNSPQILQYKTFIKNYFALTSLIEKSSIYLHIIYYSFPFRKIYTHQLLEANVTSFFFEEQELNR